MAQYRTGTASVTNGSPNVVGAGTSFLSNVSAGDLFAIQGEGVWATIQSITDDTHLVLSSNYVGTTKSGVAYAIQTDFTAQQSYPLISYGDTDTASLISLAFNSIDQKLNALQTALAEVDSYTLDGDLEFDVTGFSALKVSNSPFRNKLNNADFTVMSRATNPTVLGSNSQAWIADRWQCNNQCGASLTTTRILAPSGFHSMHAMQFEFNATAGYIDIWQYFDGQQMAALAGNDATFSMDVAITSTANIQLGLTIWGMTALDNNIRTVAIHSGSIGNSGGYPGGTSTRLSVLVPASETPGLKNGGAFIIRINMGSGATGAANVKLGALQFENGKVVNDFDLRPEAIEYTICQRWYRKVKVTQMFPATAGSQQFATTQLLSPPMRVQPTSTLLNQNRTNAGTVALAISPDRTYAVQFSSAAGLCSIDDQWALDAEFPG